MKIRLVLLMTIAFVAAAAPLRAHHSFAAEYDRSKPVSLTGVVTKVEWTNPHIWFYVDVKDEKGTLTNWGFSAAPPGVLMRRGVAKEALKIGSVIKVEGFRAKDGSNNATGGVVTFADGKSVFTNSAEDDLPRREK